MIKVTSYKNHILFDCDKGGLLYIKEAIEKDLREDPSDVLVTPDTLTKQIISVDFNLIPHLT